MSSKNRSSLGEETHDTMDDIKSYINLRLRLIELNVTEKVSTILAKIISSALAMIFFTLFIFFGSFAFSYWLADKLGSYLAGFGIVACFYLLVALLLASVGKNAIRRKLIKSFIEAFSNDSKHEK